VLVAAAPTFDLALFVLLATGVVHASIDGRRSFAVRLRAPAPTPRASSASTRRKRSPRCWSAWGS
jgi:hypothetical protein